MSSYRPATMRERAYAIFGDVVDERQRQGRLHGSRTPANPAMPNFERLAILTEEIGEVAKDSLEHDRAPNNAPALRFELVQCAAVCFAWIEGLDAGLVRPSVASVAGSETGRP